MEQDCTLVKIENVTQILEAEKEILKIKSRLNVADRLLRDALAGIKQVDKEIKQI